MISSIAKAGPVGEVLEELTKRFLVEIAKLAGAENFQPKLAGHRWKTGAPVEAESDLGQ